MRVDRLDFFQWFYFQVLFTFRIERECNKEVIYNNVTINKGMVVTVPTFALHYNEEYYPDPEKFDPQRWAADNEDKPNPYAYMPFGMGPRNCIGMRFAMEEMKIALSCLVKTLRFFPVDETPVQHSLLLFRFVINVLKHLCCLISRKQLYSKRASLELCNPNILSSVLNFVKLVFRWDLLAHDDMFMQITLSPSCLTKMFYVP